MKRTILGVAVAMLAAGTLLVAEEKKQVKCPMADIICPEHGDCAGQCREFCDRGGEALTALRARVAAAAKVKYKMGSVDHVSGACRAKNCDACQEMMDKVFKPVIKEAITDRFGTMGGPVKHAVKKDGKTTEVECTFLTGDLCDPCVETMKGEAIERLDSLMAAKKK